MQPRTSIAFVLIAFLATLAAYVLLALFDVNAKPLDTLEAAILIEVGALAGVASPKRPGS